MYSVLYNTMLWMIIRLRSKELSNILHSKSRSAFWKWQFAGLQQRSSSRRTDWLEDFGSYSPPPKKKLSQPQLTYSSISQEDPE